MKVEEIKPYAPEGGKTSQVESMFDSIAPVYDRMNKAMTAGLCAWWRNRALSDLRLEAGKSKVLDVATGTGDVAFKIYDLYRPAQVTGIDLSREMLNIARQKLSKLEDPQATRSMAFGEGDCLSLAFADDSFDLVTVAYGVRNFEHLEEGYREMYRVLKPGGEIIVIELSEPTLPVVKQAYAFHSRRVIPWLGKLMSGDNRAYSYLPESIAACPQRDEMTALMEKAGFRRAKWKSLTLGVVTIYTAMK